MTIYDFLEIFNENYETIFTLFDCNSEKLVSIDTDEFENVTELSRDDLMYSAYADCEIGSVDMWVDNGKIHIEFNIEIDEEDFDYEEI